MPDTAALARIGASQVLDVVKTALAARGTCSLVLGGGSTPKAMYTLLADNHSTEVDWTKVICYFGDERFAGSETQDTNLAMARATLLSRLPVAFHAFDLTGSAQESAIAYDRLLREHFESQQPDLIILGMGPDGHTLSLFPNQPRTQWDDPKVWSIAATAPSPFAVPSRVTVTLPFVHRCRERLFLVAGKDKAPAFAAAAQQAAAGPNPQTALPAALVKGAMWIVDQSALASSLNKNAPR